MNGVGQILALFAQSGDSAYLGEAVSQTEHALQTAHLAERDGNPSTLIAAALLHDIGHLLHDGDDDRHEAAGARYLSRHFGPAVTTPLELHVAAKRYLCVVDPHYLARLSDASQLSLTAQGGPFTEAEARTFEQLPFAAAAVKLRRWDDEAKIVGRAVPPLAHYIACLEQARHDAPPVDAP
jgi:[1-hydroxy-2-(trimethylamino)ethyl]phosphonate dioxygenase